MNDFDPEKIRSEFCTWYQDRNPCADMRCDRNGDFRKAHAQRSFEAWEAAYKIAYCAGYEIGHADASNAVMELAR